jgi:hypothetical protein
MQINASSVQIGPTEGEIKCKVTENVKIYFILGTDIKKRWESKLILFIGVAI